MVEKLIIKKLDNSDQLNPITHQLVYWNSSFEAFSTITKCTKYDNREEVVNRINAKLPPGIYEIVTILIKE
jgi:hypothetical protein